MFKTLIRVAVIFSVLLFSSVSKAADPIRIPVLNWSSQIVMANVMAQVFEEMGYTAELVPAESASRYEAVRIGDLHVAHETWESTMALPFYEAMDKGGLIDAGSHNLITFEEMGVPNWVIEEGLCPGLPNWEALKDPACAANFATADSDGKGVFIGGPVDWLKRDAEKIEALGMNFIVKNVDSAGAIWAELDAAVKQKKPIVIFNWSPNFIGAKYAGKFVNFPKHDPQCETNASWGINPNALYDCGNPANEHLKLAVNSDFKKNHPKAYKVIKKINFSSSDVDKMANYVDTDGLEVSHAAEQWLKDHKKKWSKWVK